MLLLIFLNNNFDFICNNNRQPYFVKMNPTFLGEYLFDGGSLKKCVEVTTRDNKLLNLSKTCSALINLSSVYINPYFLCKNKHMLSDCCNTVAFVINFCKNQSFLQVFENFYTFFISFSKSDDCKHRFIYIFIK